MVSVLAKAQTDWVIVTNGKLWRLYAARADNRATNYYEVDLEEALAAPDQITALKYWWLFFRATAFTGFLDTLLQQSADYAKSLGGRLKDRVFTAIFPHFAEGFIRYARAQTSEVSETSEAFRDEVFNATLTFLYRLMFILYAESLSLLPAYEERGYGEFSLYRLKRELAEAAGTIEDEAPKRIEARYRAGRHRDLRTPAKAVPCHRRRGPGAEPAHVQRRPVQRRDRGRQIPGGPRHPRPLPGAGAGPAVPRRGRQDARAGDDRLQVARRAPARLDLRGAAGVQAAHRTRAAGRGEGEGQRGLPAARRRPRASEPRLPWRQGTSTWRTTSASARPPAATTRPTTSSSTSWSTPWARCWRASSRRWSRACATRRSATASTRRMVKARGDDQSPELFWKSDAMAGLADDCLSVRTLDPAMGSGHFLVEAVDFISDRVIEFLNGWSENPVWALLARTRDDILADMERQGVSIDAEKLTRVALLKRAVLKRCVYGVDLNAMAVELAKVSLWLDAFTLGAPLSFLDHHLKWGNSLIGARVKEVQDALEGREQPSLLAGSKFAGVMLATDLMRQVSYLSDNTAEQLASSRQAFRSAADHLAPYKRMLDVYTSRWFGNPPHKSGFEPALEFLGRADVEAWLQDPATSLPEQDYMGVAKIGATALAAAQEKRFFHWELEFPEVFFAPSMPGGQDVQLRERGGFDAVVGNPPYDEVSEYYSGNTSDDSYYFSNSNPYSNTKTGRINLYRLFILRATEFVGPLARFSFIVPLTILSDSFSLGTRRRIFESLHLTAVEAFPQKDDPADRVFLDAKQSTCILVLERAKDPAATTMVRTHIGRLLLEDSPSYVTSQEMLYSFTPGQHAVPLVSQGQWNILEKRMHPRLGRILKDFASIYAGEVCDNQANARFLSDDPISGPIVLRGGNVQRYELLEDPKQGKPRYLRKALWLAERSQSERGQHTRESRIAFQKGAAIDNWRRLIAALVPENEYCFDTLGYLPFDECTRPYVTLALLNSRLWNFRFSAASTTNHVNAYELEIILLPNWNSGNTKASSSQRNTGDQLRESNSLDARDGDLASGELLMALDQNDAMIDRLEFLARQIMSLNERKQPEVKRFLSWLEARLRIRPKDSEAGIDSLTGKSIIQNYLGDYQKGEPEVSWDNFYLSAASEPESLRR